MIRPTLTPILYSPAEAAKLLGISRAKLYVMLDAGQIGSIHIGRARRLHRDEIERVASQGVAA
jgi:excisionase family DNA binding protein